MLQEVFLEKYPRNVASKEGHRYQIRPLKSADEKPLHEFFLATPHTERMFINFCHLQFFSYAH